MPGRKRITDPNHVFSSTKRADGCHDEVHAGILFLKERVGYEMKGP